MRAGWWLLAGLLACADGDGKTAGEGEDPAECSDGLDNDEDALTDCEDEGCLDATACVSEPEAVDARSCDDGIDNDLDGSIDCEDSDCDPSWCACADWAEVYVICLRGAGLGYKEYEDPYAACVDHASESSAYYDCLAEAYDADCSTSESLIEAQVAGSEC